VIEHNVDFFHFLDRLFDVFDRLTNLIGKLFPCLFNVIDLIDVKLGRERSILAPDLLINLDLELGK